ncbi:MAG: hypothetical protein DSZ24_04870, partial [Thermodesulfatator sp.]
IQVSTLFVAMKYANGCNSCQGMIFFLTGKRAFVIQDDFQGLLPWFPFENLRDFGRLSRTFQTGLPSDWWSILGEEMLALSSHIYLVPWTYIL